VRTLTAFTLGAVMLQGLLGGLTVRYQLPVWTSSMHGTLGQVFFRMVVALAYSHSKEWRATENVQSVADSLQLAAFRMAVKGLIVAIFLQLVFGNLMRHSEAGLAVPDFPTMGQSYLPSLSAETIGKINELRAAVRLPAVSELQVFLHLLHRLWAVVVVAAVLWLSLSLRRLKSVPRQVRVNMRWLEILLVVQLTLGILVILSLRSPIVATLHVVIGALMLAGAVLLALRAKRLFH
jgi:cytochrome c oxidase assembly protein subunit 15